MQCWGAEVLGCLHPRVPTRKASGCPTSPQPGLPGEFPISLLQTPGACISFLFLLLHSTRILGSGLGEGAARGSPSLTWAHPIRIPIPIPPCPQSQPAQPRMSAPSSLSAPASFLSLLLPKQPKKQLKGERRGGDEIGGAEPQVRGGLTGVGTRARSKACFPALSTAEQHFASASQRRRGGRDVGGARLPRRPGGGAGRDYAREM